MISTKAGRFAAVLWLTACPLLFFTDLTRNPYYSQITLLNLSVLALWVVWIVDGISSGEIRVPRTSLDMPLWIFFLVATLSWGVSWLTHNPFFRASIASEGLRVWAFTLVNGLLVYHAAVRLAQPDGKEAHFKTVWIFTVLIGLLWLKFPAFRDQTGPAASLWGTLWDPYGALVWLLTLVLSWMYVSGGGRDRLLHLGLAGGLLASFYGIVQYSNVEVIWPKVLNPYGGRAVSTFGNPNFLSSYLVMLFPVALAYYLEPRPWTKRLPYLLAMAVYWASLLCSLTRSSWAGVAAAAACVAWGAWRERERWADAKKSLVLVGVLMLVMAVFWPRSRVGYNPTVLERLGESIRTFQSDTKKEASTYGPSYQRFLIWSSAWKMWEERPLLGKGWGTIELFYPFYQGAFLFDSHFTNHRTHANNAHNIGLELASQTGLLGLGCALWLLWVMLRAVRNVIASCAPDHRLLAWGLWGGTVGMIVDNLLNVSLLFAIPAFLFWWQLGLLFSLSPKCARIETLDVKALPRKIGFSLAAALLAVLGVRAIRHWKAEVHYFQGFKLNKQPDRSKQAIVELEESHRLHRYEVNNDYELGNAYARDGQWDKALWAYGEALAANPGYDEIYFNMAVVKSNRNTIPEAIRGFDAALFINPLSVSAYRALGNVYLRDVKGYPDAGLTLFEQAVRFFPQDKDFWNNLGVFQTAKGNDQGALDAYTKAWELDPQFQEAGHNLQMTLDRLKITKHPYQEFGGKFRALESSVQSKDYPKALRLAREITQRWPNHVPSRLYLANLLVVAKNYPEAIAEYKIVLEKQPQLHVARNNLAYAYVQSAQPDLARKEYATVLSYDPQNAMANEGLKVLTKK